MAGYVKDIFNIASSSTFPDTLITQQTKQDYFARPNFSECFSCEATQPLPEYQLCEILEALQGILSADTMMKCEKV